MEVLRTLAFALAVGRLVAAAPLKSNTSEVPLLTAYWEVQQASTLPPDAIDFDIVDLALLYPVIPRLDGSLSSLDDGSAKGLVDAAHSKGKMAGFTVGGGISGSVAFSSLVSNATLRLDFAVASVNMATQYGFDVIEFDWEYPESDADMAGLVDLLQQIRNLKSDLILGLTLGWAGTEYKQSLPQLVSLLDYGSVMAYDSLNVYTSTTTGSVAPLTECDELASNSTVRQAISVWRDAGFPPEKLVLATVAQGFNFSNVAYPLQTTHGGSSLFQPFSNPSADSWTVTSIRAMFDQGVLTSDGKHGANGFQRMWDTCTQTPYMYSERDQRLIAYEDAESLKAKVEWIVGQGLAGVSLYSCSGDGPGFMLAKVIRKTLDGDEAASGGLAAVWVILALALVAGLFFAFRKRITLWSRKVSGKETPPLSFSWFPWQWRKSQAPLTVAKNSRRSISSVQMHAMGDQTPDAHRYSTFTINDVSEDDALPTPRTADPLMRGRNTMHTISEVVEDPEEADEGEKAEKEARDLGVL